MTNPISQQFLSKAQWNERPERRRRTVMRCLPFRQIMVSVTTAEAKVIRLQNHRGVSFLWWRFSAPHNRKNPEESAPAVLRRDQPQTSGPLGPVLCFLFPVFCKIRKSVFTLVDGFPYEVISRVVYSRTCWPFFVKPSSVRAHLLLH